MQSPRAKRISSSFARLPGTVRSQSRRISARRGAPAGLARARACRRARRRGRRGRVAPARGSAPPMPSSTTSTTTVPRRGRPEPSPTRRHCASPRSRAPRRRCSRPFDVAEMRSAGSSTISTGRSARSASVESAGPRPRSSSRGCSAHELADLLQRQRQLRLGRFEGTPAPRRDRSSRRRMRCRWSATVTSRCCARRGGCAPRGAARRHRRRRCARGTPSGRGSPDAGRSRRGRSRPPRRRRTGRRGPRSP